MKARSSPGDLLTEDYTIHLTCDSCKVLSRLDYHLGERLPVVLFCPACGHEHEIYGCLIIEEGKHTLDEVMKGQANAKEE